MSKKEILAKDYNFVSVEELEAIEESEFIFRLENCGGSGLYPSKQWYIAELCDDAGEPTGEEVNLYL